MGKIVIELDSGGIQKLLKSSEIADVCESQARKMTQATGVSYVPNVYVGRTRVNASGYKERKL